MENKNQLLRVARVVGNSILTDYLSIKLNPIVFTGFGISILGYWVDSQNQKFPVRGVYGFYLSLNK